jgi:hypothetical protein
MWLTVTSTSESPTTETVSASRGCAPSKSGSLTPAHQNSPKKRTVNQRSRPPPTVRLTTRRGSTTSRRSTRKTSTISETWRNLDRVGTPRPRRQTATSHHRSRRPIRRHRLSNLLPAHNGHRRHTSVTDTVAAQRNKRPRSTKQHHDRQDHHSSQIETRPTRRRGIDHRNAADRTGIAGLPRNDRMTDTDLPGLDLLPAVNGRDSRSRPRQGPKSPSAGSSLR